MPKLDPWIESNDLGLLEPRFLEAVLKYKEICSERGFEVGFGTTVRGPAAQAKWWCRDKSLAEVRFRKAVLAEQAPKLSQFLSEEFAQRGPGGSTFLPGQSWHQWAQAVEVCVVVGDKATWKGSALEEVAKFAEEVGLTQSAWASHKWKVFRDWQLQASSCQDPFLEPWKARLNWAGLQAAMCERYEL